MKMKISNIGIPYNEIINTIKVEIGIDKDFLSTIIYDEIDDSKYKFYFFFKPKNADYDLFVVSAPAIEDPDFNTSPYLVLESLKKLEMEVLKYENNKI
jgi:hypothetical protein